MDAAIGKTVERRTGIVHETRLTNTKGSYIIRVVYEIIYTHEFNLITTNWQIDR